MDTRAARRAAEKAARDLITSRTALIGELGVARAERAQLEDEVTAANERGHQLVAAAQDQAARLLETAQAAARDAEQRYADVYTAATAAGWMSADLAALGFSLSPDSTRRRRANRTDPAGSRTPEQPADSALPSPAA